MDDHEWLRQEAEQVLLLAMSRAACENARRVLSDEAYEVLLRIDSATSAFADFGVSLSAVVAFDEADVSHLSERDIDNLLVYVARVSMLDHFWPKPDQDSEEDPKERS